MFITVAKKDGRIEEFDCQKIISAITKSAGRVSVAFTKDTEYDICEFVKGQAIEYLDFCNKGGSVPVEIMHNFVEQALDKCNVTVANSYRHYRDSKKLLGGMFAKVCENIDQVQYRGDKSNANSDSKLLTTQRSIAYGKFNDERYKLFFLDPETREAAKDGYIYIHDRSARLDNMNCCLLDIQAVFKGGFEMGNIAYTEPKSVDVACDVMGDVIMAAASSQYGGLSVRIDDFLAPYCKKSFDNYYQEYLNIVEENCALKGAFSADKAYEYAEKKTRRELEQGLQGLEIKLNSVASSRGDYPFVSFAFGEDSGKYAKMVSESALKVRMNGQGKEGFKKPVLFPKLIFLYHEDLHGPGKEMEDLFNLAVECSSKAMYPDFLSLSGEGYVPKIYKIYKKVVFPMGQQ